MVQHNDPLRMPATGEAPFERLERLKSVAGSSGEEYLQRRRIPVTLAQAAGVRFDADLAGRPALVVALTDRSGNVTSLHGRYLHVRRGEEKMLTFGAGGGVIEVLGGLQAEEPILVEGLFDALSLASCGWPCVATIGRWAPWLGEAWQGRTVWLGFDTGRPGEAEVTLYRRRLQGCHLKRLLPPPRCKDWNTALVKRGTGVVARWVRESLERGGAQA